jgi:sulfatase maturation enzyme AslB (radical SAM superfamily)
MTLSDAIRLAGPLSFNLMIKPAGSLCNLGCSYCYYLDKAEIYSGREPVMSIDMLETVIRKYIETCETPEVTFNWHGGEPLVLGKDFFRKVLEFERRYADGKVIHIVNAVTLVSFIGRNVLIVYLHHVAHRHIMSINIPGQLKGNPLAVMVVLDKVGG